jgi:hypothetical protein
MKTIHADTPAYARTGWLKRAGLAGTMFFFIKGMLWIIVPAVLAWFGSSGD